MSQSTIDKILDIAEQQIRAGGYNACSFREISKAVGIKSASVHYHFPTKVDLGIAVTERYRQRFNQQLATIAEHSDDKTQKLQRYVELFAHALTVDDKMCLCGMLASESDVLPEAIQHAAKLFFTDNLAWLREQIFTEPSQTGLAELTLSGLEGALVLSRINRSADAFGSVSEHLQRLLH